MTAQMTLMTFHPPYMKKLPYFLFALTLSGAWYYGMFQPVVKSGR